MKRAICAGSGGGMKPDNLSLEDWLWMVAALVGFLMTGLVV